MYRFYLGNGRIEEAFIYLSGGDVNHIKNVLRMKCGEPIMVCDGTGHDYECRIEQLGAQEVIARIEDITSSYTELPVRITLFQGLPKKDKMELILQKAVELGASEIVPVMTKRTIVKLEDKKKEEKKLERWNAISESAAKQSGRGMIPKVLPVMNFNEAVAYAKNLQLMIIPYELADRTEMTKQCMKRLTQVSTAGIFIGPEGGFEPSEVECAKAQGAYEISLGKRILRTETAGLAILSIAMYELECNGQTASE